METGEGGEAELLRSGILNPGASSNIHWLQLWGG